VFQWRYTSTGGVAEDIIRPVVSVSLEIYFCWRSHRGYHPPLVESSRICPVGSVSLEIYLCWWSHRGYHPPSSQCFTGDIPLLEESSRISSAQYSVFHWRYTSAGGVTEDIIRPVVSVSLAIYLCWWSQRGYHPPSSQCFTGYRPLLVESPRISSAQ
jgi:hypothetical protein